MKVGMAPPTATPEQEGLREQISTSSAPGRKFKVNDLDSIRIPLAVFKLARQPVSAVIVKPKDYFVASNELVVIALVVCWAITAAVDFNQAWRHPARNYVGHLNPCFGWDYAPASYFAVAFAGCDVYLAFRYASLEARRTYLLDLDNSLCFAERFSLVTSYMHAFASVLWLLLWSVGPPDGQWTAHLAIFSTCVVLRYFCALGNYLENAFGSPRQRKRVLTKHTIHVTVYGFVTLVLPALYFSDILIYNAQGRQGIDPPIPWYILEIMDVAWVLCLASSKHFSVPEPPLKVVSTVLEFDEEYDVDENEVGGGLLGRKGRVQSGVELVA